MDQNVLPNSRNVNTRDSDTQDESDRTAPGRAAQNTWERRAPEAPNPANDYKPKLRVQSAQVCAESSQGCTQHDGLSDESMLDSVHSPTSSSESSTEIRKPPKGNCLSEKYAAIPLKVFEQSTMTLMLESLEADTDTRNGEHVKQNWEGLAEYMNIDPQVINYIGIYRQNKTAALLQVWNRCGERTIGQLFVMLRKLGCDHMLRSKQLVSKIHSAAVRNAKRTKYAKQKNMSVEENEDDNDWHVLIDAAEAVRLRNEEAAEDTIIVVQDTQLKEGEKRVMFDAYVSFSEQDLPFVREVIKYLEEDNNLKLCLKERDLLPGSSTHYCVANLIAERCKKLIVVMSRSYQLSEECNYQSKVAMAMNCPQVVVMSEECKIPPAMQIMSILRYNDLPVTWFWRRLFAAITWDGEDIFKPMGQSADQMSPRIRTAQIQAQNRICGHHMTETLKEALKSVGIRSRKRKSKSTKKKNITCDCLKYSPA